MAWPHWIEELKRRYLADESNVFVLHGAVQGATFDVQGEELDCVGVLRAFLSRTRPIVGILRPWPHPSRLEFAGIADRNQFENLVKAHDLIEGHIAPLRETHADEALARIWRALSTLGTDQAYIVTDADRLLPGHRTRVEAIPGAPALFDWPTDPGLRRSNNVLIFVAQSEESVRAELVDAAVSIRVAVAPRPSPDEPRAPEVPQEATGPDHDRTPTGLPPEIDPELEETETFPAAAPAPHPGPELDDVRRDLEATLLRTLLAHPLAHRPARIPVMDAVGQVIAHHRPDVWGTLTLGIDHDGAPTVHGAGAERFLAAWRSDIALDAAAGMLLKGVEGDYTDQRPPPLDTTAVTALSKRILKVLARL